MSYFSTPSLLAIAEIVWINILLSGDNALVIALACRGLPRERQWIGIILGSAVAIALRLAFTGIVVQLLAIPLVRIAGGTALLWIAIKLVSGDVETNDDKVAASSHLWGAIRAIALADLVMSFDNVVAIAAIARGNPVLLVIGLLVSIPLIVIGARLVMLVLTRFPVLLWVGAILLGWTAGEMAILDPWLVAHIGLPSEAAQTSFAIAGALLACGGTIFLRRRAGAASVAAAHSDKSP